MNYIVTHTSPDWDAIGYAWLMQRFGGAAEMDVRFVNTGSPDQALLAGAYSVGDTGREFDPARRRFDHHHFSGREANATCATLQVYEWLCGQEYTPALLAIRPLIDLIYCGDTGSPLAGAAESRKLGIHALLSTWKARRLVDDVLMERGLDLLDDLAEGLIVQANARVLLAEHMIYRSADGLVVALQDAPQGATFAAFEAGARLVCFASAIVLADGTTSYARGIQRGGEGVDVHIGALIGDVLAGDPVPALVREELALWFRHEAGFFAGRGTAKAPASDAMQCSIGEIAATINVWWVR